MSHLQSEKLGHRPNCPKGFGPMRGKEKRPVFASFRVFRGRDFSRVQASTSKSNLVQPGFVRQVGRVLPGAPPYGAIREIRGDKLIFWKLLEASVVLQPLLSPPCKTPCRTKRLWRHLRDATRLRLCHFSRSKPFTDARLRARDGLYDNRVDVLADG